MTISLNVRLIDPDIRVWRVFPGQGYNFRNDFLNRGLVFLDAPNLNPEHLLQTADRVPAIAMSQEIKQDIIHHGYRGRLNLDIGNFRSARQTKSRLRFATALDGLIFHARQGDLIVMPSPLSERTVYVGEFSSNATEFVETERYGVNIIPGRAVNWINKISEGQVSENLSKFLRQSFPFSILEKSLWNEIISLTYHNYQYQGQFSSTIFNTGEVTSDDSAYLSLLSKLASAIAEIEELNNLDHINFRLIDAIIKSYSSEYTCSHECDVHSPGFNRYTSATTAAVALIALVGIFSFLAEAPANADLQNEIRRVALVNTAAVSDPHCIPRVAEISKRLLLAIPVDQLAIMCENARKARAGAGFQASQQ